MVENVRSPSQVFQRRQDGSVDFYRNWTEYQHMFGDLEGNFWLGEQLALNNHQTNVDKRL